MLGFQKLNVNPKVRKTGDCVTRALSKVMRIDYNQVVLDLAKLQVETGYDSHSKQCYELYLKQHGWIKHKQPRYAEDGTKYLVGDIYKLLYPYERAIISCAHHLTCKDSMDIIDTWDCRRKTIGNYYTHPDDNPYETPMPKTHEVKACEPKRRVRIG
jgi:hypothetical protein